VLAIFLWVTNTLLALVWSAVVYRTHALMRDLKRLSFAAPASDLQMKYKVSAILQVRNEKETVEGIISALLNQNGADMQVIAVDDDSTDGTFEHLEELAKTDSRLSVIQQKRIPPGWASRCYAFEMGQGLATGDWLLFTDGALSVGPRAVFNAVATMERERLVHLTLCPRIAAKRLLEAMLLPILVLLTHFRFISPNALDTDSTSGVGVGAFNLVGAEAYRLRGTHAQIRGSLNDEMALGRLMRQESGRGMILRAVGQVKRHFVGSKSDLVNFSGSEVWAGCGQNAFLTFLIGLALFSVPLTCALALGLLISGMASQLWISLNLLVLIFWGLIAALGLIRVRGLVRYPFWTLILMPVAACVFGMAVLRVAFIAFVFKKVSWHGHEYRAEDLVRS
tara:strand:+ start:1185 stop:2366 length:1182 start_codon:yes stop_codon:yes gene_type:complete